MIISASRRTDIPAFYGDWLIERIKSGDVTVKNPFNLNQFKHICLSPESIDCFVFWTKNPISFFTHIKQIIALNIPFYFHFTLNAYDKEYEPNLPDKNILIKTFKELSTLVSPFPIIWRYDPIIIDNLHSTNWHLHSFKNFCNSLKGYTSKCITSFITMYSKCKRKLKNYTIIDLSSKEKTRLLKEMNCIAINSNIELNICASETDYSEIGVLPAKCIDNELIEKISGNKLQLIKDKHQRKNCNCVRSVDIGEYNTCMHNCLYCYANK